MGKRRTYCKLGEHQLRTEYTSRMTHQLIDDLLSKGARFYTYGYLDFLYFNSQVVDLHRKNDSLAYLIEQKMAPAEYEKDVVEKLISFASPHYINIPRNSIGTINGVSEPKDIPMRRSNATVRAWVKEAIESGKIPQTKGTP